MRGDRFGVVKDRLTTGIAESAREDGGGKSEDEGEADSFQRLRLPFHGFFVYSGAVTRLTGGFKSVAMDVPRREACLKELPSTITALEFWSIFVIYSVNFLVGIALECYRASCRLAHFPLQSVIVRSARRSMWPGLSQHVPYPQGVDACSYYRHSQNTYHNCLIG